jgi:prepilin-type N-terminal cleavage/methylation domain-containing protein
MEPGLLMRASAQARGGFSMVEVLIALSVLSGIVLMMAPTAAKFPSAVANSQRRVQAAAVAEAQIALIRVYPQYDSLTPRFNGAAAGVPFPGWTRTTSVVRNGAGTTADLTRVTVTVTGPGLPVPIKRTATVAAP